MASLAQLETDAKHVDYEISMFMELSDRLLRQRDIPADDVLRRAVFESCLLHFRALLEFFRTDTKYVDDLRATDYIDNPAHKSAIGLLAPNESERARMGQLHKALAHIVSSRDQLDTNWSEADLALVTSRLKLFFAHLPAPRRRWFLRASPWFVASVPEMAAQE